MRLLKTPPTDDTELLALEKHLLPSMLMEQACSLLLGLINSLIAGTVSSVVLAGIGQVTTVNNLISYFFNYFSQGGMVMVAQHMGAGNGKEARKSAVQAINLGAIISLLTTVALFIWRVPILHLLFGACEADVMAQSVDYFTYTLLATPFWFLYFQCAGVMRGAGDGKTPMKISVVMNVLNLLFSVLLVFVFPMEGKGLGIALLLSVIIGSILVLLAVHKPASPICLRGYYTLSVNARALKAIVMVGLPAAVERLLYDGGKVILQVFMAGMGTTAISAMQVCGSGTTLIQLPITALMPLSTTIVGRRAGTGDRALTQRTMRYLLQQSNVWAFWTTVAMCALSFPACAIFSRDPVVLHMAVLLSLIVGGSTSVMFTPSFVLPSALRGVRDVRYSLILASISVWVTRVGGSYLFGIALGWGVYGVAFANALDVLVRSIGFEIHYRRGTWLHYVEPADATP